MPDQQIREQQAITSRRSGSSVIKVSTEAGRTIGRRRLTIGQLPFNRHSPPASIVSLPDEAI
ncbi:MAG: hypothetical protein EBZ13_00530 [Planctomycetia bacterium]|nr:hypothetical protein [Planctomycetia bacterium]